MGPIRGVSEEAPMSSEYECPRSLEELKAYVEVKWGAAIKICSPVSIHLIQPDQSKKDPNSPNPGRYYV